MIQNFLRRLGLVAAPIQPPVFVQTRPVAQMPPLRVDEEICLVGDLHGCSAQLDRLLALRAGRFARARLVFLGDMVDRGPDSAGVLHRLKALSEEGVICLSGNHEAMMLAFLDDPLEAGRGWLSHGGLETLESFGVPMMPRNDAERLDLRDRFREVLGEEMITWLRGLPLWWQSGNLVAVHAALDPALPPEQQGADVMQWGHPAFGRILRQDGLWVAHGHVISERAYSRQGCLALDTGAYATGKLSFGWIDPNLPESERLTFSSVQ